MANRIKKTFKFVIFFIFFLGLLGGGFYFLQAKTDIFLIFATMEKNREIVPDENITINFSQAVLPGSFAGKIRVSPANNIGIRWENNNRTLVIVPQKYWDPETEYAVEVGEGRSQFYASVKKQTFEFSTIAYPTVKSVFPSDGAKDMTIGMEDPIIVSFNGSFKNFYIRFDFHPTAEITYQIDPEKTEFRILPKQPFVNGEKYALDVFAKYIKDSDAGYHKIFSSSFETLMPAPLVMEKDFDLRLEQAKKFTKPQIAEGKYIDINLAAQVMTIFENGSVLDAYMVSSGKRGLETPKGSYKVENKALRPWSKAYGLFMPNWMALVPSGKFGIHELPEWPGGYKEGQSHLGTPVSHGCVRLGVGPAKRVFDWAEIGTPVVVY